MKVLPPTPQNIATAASLIKKGGLVAFPTETVYGLAAHAFNTEAVTRVFEVKRRPAFEPLIVHIARLSWLEKICFTNKTAMKLVRQFWPGPLAIVLKKKGIVPAIVTGGLQKVAVRMPAHSVALQLITKARTPIVAPSANLHNHLSPTTAEHVIAQIGNEIDLILKGSCPIGVESTVIDLTEKKPIILRPGGTPVEEIEKIVGQTKLSPVKPAAFKHFQTPLKILRKRLKLPAGKKIGLLAFNKSNLQRQGYEIVEILSEKGDLREAASNLFAALHRLDKAGLDIIYAEPVPKVGLGLAIMDRLCKLAGETCF